MKLHCPGCWRHVERGMESCPRCGREFPIPKPVYVDLAPIEPEPGAARDTEQRIPWQWFSCRPPRVDRDPYAHRDIVSGEVHSWKGGNGVWACSKCRTRDLPPAEFMFCPGRGGKPHKLHLGVNSMGHVGWLCNKCGLNVPSSAAWPADISEFFRAR